MRIVDVHAHLLTPSYLRFLEDNHIDARAEEGFPLPSWSPQEQLELVERAGIDYAVTTLSSPHIHLGDDDAACAAASSINDEFADFCHSHPDRFGFCAVLPLPCAEGSVREAARALDDLGALGVKVPSNALGTYLGDPKLESLFEFLDDRGAVVVIHPCTPAVYPKGCFTALPKPLFEFISDTTRTVIDLIARGTLARHPHVKVVVPHCGSFVPEVAHRLVGISDVLVPVGMMEPCDVLGSVSQLYFDVTGRARPVMLEALLKVADPTRIMFGSDWPYTPQAQIIDAITDLTTCPELDDIREDVFWRNATALFGL